MESMFVRELEARGERKATLRILSMLITKGIGAQRSQPLLGRLARCSPESLEQITTLFERELDEAALLHELEQLLPK